jgi:polygalacturonase
MGDPGRTWYGWAKVIHAEDCMRRQNTLWLALICASLMIVACQRTAVLAVGPTTMAAGDTLDAKAFGAVGDGVTLNTAALQRAIDLCTANGGGTIRLSAGRYVTGTIQLKDNVTLHLDANAFLLGSSKAADYRNVDPFLDGTGAAMGYALVAAIGAKNVGIDGPGTIDGQGKALSVGQIRYTVRPFLVRWVHCTGVAMKGTTLLNSGAWGVNFFQCKDVAAGGLTIRNRSGLANNDGIDIDSCENVAISNCDIDSGDDAVCLKTTSTQPCRDITATNCTLKTSCNAIKLGTESIGDFEHIRVSGCQIHQTGMSGIALYSVDGAILHDVVVSDVTMDGIQVPISIRLGARLKTFRAGDTAKPVGAIRDVTVRNVTVTGAKQIGMLINGVPGHAVEGLSFENIKMELAGGGTAADGKVQLAEKEAAYPEYSMFGKVMPAYGFYLRHVDGVSFKNVQASVTKADARPEVVTVDVSGVQPADFPTMPATLPQ